MDVHGATTAITQQLPSPTPASDYALLGGSLFTIVITVGYVLSKFKKDTTVNSIESALYKNLSDRIESISATLVKAEADREALRIKAQANEARIVQLEKHEKENELLRKRLEEKDHIISSLQHASDVKHNQLIDLQNRIHELEMQMQQRLMDCEICDHKRMNEARTRATDLVDLPGGPCTHAPTIEDEL